MTNPIPKPYPFRTVPSKEGVLKLLPPFRVPPIILFSTKSYWVAIEDDARMLANALGLPLYVDQSLLRSHLSWIAFDRSKIDPKRFNPLDPCWRGYPMILTIN